MGCEWGSGKSGGMELTPLRRAASGAVLGGVCAGLARRWQVDPTVLRIAMVLLALLGGVGIAFYVGAVLLIPRDGSSEFPLYRHAPFTRSWSPAAAIGAVVCLGVLIIVLVGSWLPFGLAPAVGLAFLWYFGFHRRRGQAARPPVARPGGRPRSPARRLGSRRRCRPSRRLISSGRPPTGGPESPKSALCLRNSWPTPRRRLSRQPAPTFLSRRSIGRSPIRSGPRPRSSSVPCSLRIRGPRPIHRSDPLHPEWTWLCRSAALCDVRGGCGRWCCA